MNISVIIPVYNVEKYIERCLRSVMNQTFTEGVECIIVNDCTPDNSMKIAEKLINEYKGSILFRIISHKQNKGIAATRNTGLEAATGTYIQYIDSDDYIEPMMLEKMYKEALQTDADIIICDYIIEINNKQRYSNLIHKNTTREYFKDILIDAVPAFIWNKLFKRALFTQHQFFIPNEVKSMGEDFIINTFAFYYANKIVSLPKPYIHYCRENINSYCNKINNESLESQKAAIDYIENTLFKNIKEDSFFYLPFMESKNRVKTAILYYGNRAIKKKYRNLFNEASQYIFNFHVRKLPWKLILFFNNISPIIRDLYIFLIKRYIQIRFLK